ncbi:hypothetical protein EPJ69_04580 [Brachyspira aalborgi]|uniref:Uncharacterized protein n=1 Tax=Brachyspira aalborgi TaxID=29522 RepID=A0A5C8E9S7_9SPIR|nr:hypothetical protein [Brachyspira aalborgi]TXJ33661.1 hypothetical protein EPJ69_04580 [Brachyspira aalborgi]
MNFESFCEYLKNNNKINYNLLNEKNAYYVNYFLYRIKVAFDNYSKESSDINKRWFNNRLNIFMKDEDIRNLAGILGELQIYGLLSNSPFKYWLKCVKTTNEKKTPDFIYENYCRREKIKVNIEVASSLGTKDEKKQRTEQNEIYPYGKPKREGIDNSLSEVISMINRIKEPDSQMKEEDINILAINFVNPIGECIFLNILKERGKPYFINKEGDNNTIYTGGIWQAFYSKKGDRIFGSIGMDDYIKEEIYKMEYNSRFQGKSVVDFAIINTYEGVFIYQNFNRKIEIPKHIYKCLMSLDNINIDNVFLNFPINNLEERVNYYRELGEAYLKEAEESKSYV